MRIPILNIYYLLTYAWNKLEEGEKVQAGISDYDQIEDLFAKMLVNGCDRLLRRGINSDYVPRLEIYAGVKGKIDFAKSINGNTFRHGKTYCQFDDYSRDIAINQIIKATLWRLSKLAKLDQGLRKDSQLLYWKFSDVSDIELRTGTFARIRLHRNNSFYDLILKVCRIIYETTSLQEDGTFAFSDFIRDPKVMPYLFQEFVKNFYRIEFPDLRVYSPKIQWDALPVGISDVSLLPQMQTDICVENEYHKTIIDTKFYADIVTHRFERERFHAGNLYQIYSYLRNLEADKSDPRNATVSGILLYPTVNEDYDQSYEIGGHLIRVVTVDLGAHWGEIAMRLQCLLQEFQAYGRRQTNCNSDESNSNLT